MSFFFAGLASAFAWKAFEYSHFIERTNERNMERFDKKRYPTAEERRNMAELYRQARLKELILLALFSAIISNILR